VETELEEELRFHFDKHVSKFIQSGFTPEEAKRRARLEFGGMEQLKEEHRDARGVNFVGTLLQDVRYGLRILARTPVITSVAILSLALGIGANTAIFSLIDTVMLRMLPVDKPEELVQVRRLDPKRGALSSTSFTNALWEQLRDHQDIFSGVFAWSDTRFDLSQGGTVHFADGLFVSGDYFKTLGVQPAAGRLLTAADDQRGCPGVAVLSYSFWQEHFGGAENAIGGTISLDHRIFEIAGITAAGFHGVEIGQKYDLAIPICTAPIFDGKESRLDRRSWWWLRIIGRLKPGLGPDQVNARLRVLSPQIFEAALPQDWDAEDQKSFLQRIFTAKPAATGTSYLRERFGQPLKILMAVVGLVLLIACANIASLMLARAATRNKEIAVRKALGASRARLIRQLLTESILLSAAGALLGILFAGWGNALLVRYISTGRNQVFLDLSLDGRVLTFTVLIALFTGALFGVLPALRATNAPLSSAMKGSQAEESERRIRFRPGKWIVAAQVALSLVLLVTAGLFLRSFVKLITLDVGFDRNNVLVVSANLKTANIAPDQRLTTFEDIENRLRAIPGVISAGRSVMTPISGYTWNDLVHVDSPNAPKGEDSVAFFNFVSPGYFGTMRTPITAGRGFDVHDTKTSTSVAIVNQTLVRKFYGGANPTGKLFHLDPPKPGLPEPVIQIVGIAKDSKYERLSEETSPTVFFPITQIPENDEEESFEIRSATPPTTLVSAVQESIALVNKEIPLEFHTLAKQVDDSLVQERLLATLSGFFGGLALLLAMIGLYGALSYLVALRRAEFGIRMALGAMPVSILRLVMKDVAAVLVGGVAAGVLLSFLTVALLQKMLFGLSPHDPITLAIAIGLLSAVALLAGYLPARRAMRVDPMVALRYE
jgi:putative ABC transport system permease protein